MLYILCKNTLKANPHISDTIYVFKSTQ